MKILILSFFIVLSSSLFAQNKVYLITEQCTSGGNTSMDKVVVTAPDGSVEEYDITHFMSDVVAHDKEFNIILNGVISKGYELFTLSGGHGDMANMKSIWTRTWYLTESK